MNPSVVTTTSELAALAQRWRNEARLAFDTEAASFHRYVDRVYLIQASSDQATTIIDPLAVQDLAPVGELLADPHVQVVFHDADYDLRSLDRDYGFRARNIFDTRIAAQLLGEPGIGLGALLLKYFGVTLNKKMQRADWSVRPLTAEMIEYAAADTSHLTRLRDILEQELQRAGRLDWAQEEFARLESVRWTGTEASPDDYADLKGANLLHGPSRNVLRAVYLWREQQASRMDRAPFRVLTNETMLGLARTAPGDLASLKQLPGMSGFIGERYGQELIELIRAALAAPVVPPERRNRARRVRNDPETEARLERLKQLRNDRARDLGLEPGVLAANAALETLARSTGQLQEEGPVLRNWQRRALGETAIGQAMAGPVGQHQ